MGRYRNRHTTLAAKFNALTIGLILLAAAGVFLRQTAHERAAAGDALREHGISLAQMLAQASEYGIYTQDEAALQPLVAGPFVDPSVAYVAVLAADQRLLCARTGALTPRPPPLGGNGIPPGTREVSVTELEVDGIPCMEIVVPVRPGAPGALVLGEGSASGEAPAPLGYVRLGLSLQPLRARFREGLRGALVFTTIVVGIGAVLTILLTRRITEPIRHLRKAAEDIAEGAGDLTQVFAARSTDEVGALAASFNRFLSRLREMVSRVRGAATRLAGTMTSIDEASAGTRAGARSQALAADETFRAIEHIGLGIGEIARNTDSLLTSARRSASAALEMESSGRHIATRVEGLSTAVEQVSSAIQELSGGSQQIMNTAEVLAGSATATAAAIAHAGEAVKGIEAGAATTQRLCETVTKDAAQGKSAVEETVKGIREIQEAAEQTGQVVEDLGESCTEIGGILEVISEVAAQTSLLGLNAAILAAQAGESGRGFTVVASEMGDLADRVAQATAEIGDIIGKLQHRAQQAVRGMRVSRERVHAEVARAETAAAALGTIQASAGHALGKVRQIKQATEEHANSSEAITASVQQVAAAVEAIAVTIQQQTAGLQQLEQAAATMAEIAREVRARADEQVGATEEVRRMAHEVKSSVEGIDGATRGQKTRSQEVIEAISGLRDVSLEGIRRAEGLDQTVQTLAEQIRLLEREVRAFRA
jgi:methyl-accepting chemotaxis protein